MIVLVQEYPKTKKTNWPTAKSLIEKRKTIFCVHYVVNTFFDHIVIACYILLNEKVITKAIFRIKLEDHSTKSS